MTTVTSTSTSYVEPSQVSKVRYWIGGLLLLEFILMFVPLAILGQAIDWPASLDRPASVNLPLILEQASAVRLGYLIYLAYSLLIIPVALVISRILSRSGHTPLLLQVANGFAVGSAVLRALGIVRWLTTMPVLAKVYVDPATTPALKESVASMYEMMNAYAGSVGELLGVSLFAAIWIGLTSFVIIRDNGLPRWIGFFGVATALAFFVSLISLFDIDPGPLTFVSVTMVQFWWLFIGLIVLFRPRLMRYFAESSAA